MEVEMVLSIIAIVISVATAFFEYLWNKKVAILNLEYSIHSEIYNEYLINKIPKARSYILYTGAELKDTDTLIGVLNEIRHNSLFYKYEDVDFYYKLYNFLQKIEDKLVLKTGEMSNDEFSVFNEELNKDIRDLYTIIMSKCVGTKVKI